VNITRIAHPGKLRLIYRGCNPGHCRPGHPLSQIASARTAEAARAGDGPKRTIVWVHGAWADSSSWASVQAGVC